MLMLCRCDADPSALARYVLALLKKDKPAAELRQCMAEQLDVFLGAETTQFLHRLFEVIESKEYLTPTNVASAAATIIANLTAVAAATSSSSAASSIAAASAVTSNNAFADSTADIGGSSVKKEQTPPIEVS